MKDLESSSTVKCKIIVLLNRLSMGVGLGTKSQSRLDFHEEHDESKKYSNID